MSSRSTLYICAVLTGAGLGCESAAAQALKTYDTQQPRAQTQGQNYNTQVPNYDTQDSSASAAGSTPEPQAPAAKAPSTPDDVMIAIPLRRRR